LVHLNLTSHAFLPLIRDAISKGRDLTLLGTGPYRRDVVGWFVYWITNPPVRFRIKTTAPFVPAGVEPKDRILDAFDMLQEQVAGCVREADGLDLARLRIISPFDSRLNELSDGSGHHGSEFRQFCHCSEPMGQARYSRGVISPYSKAPIVAATAIGLLMTCQTIAIPDCCHCHTPIRGGLAAVAGVGRQGRSVSERGILG